jgi:hypothetical protein
MKNKNILFLSFILTLISLLSEAQITTSIVNQKTLGGINQDMLVGSKKTVDNGYILYGYSSSGISGDKTESCRGGNDFWIIKLNANLNIQWQKTIGGIGEDLITDLILCADSSFLCVGSSSSPISNEKTVPCFGNYDYWVLKLDNNGNLIWQNVYGGTDSDQANSIIQFNDGKIFISGMSKSNISGNKTENCRGSNDYWIICTDSLGNKLWDKTIGGNLTDRDAKIVKSSNDKLIILGSSNSPISNEKTSPCFGNLDLWIVEIDTGGNIIWDKTYGGSENDGFGFEDIILCDDNIYLCSSSSSGISGNKSDSCRGFDDYWILKLDKNGNKFWDKTIGGSNYDIPNSILYAQNDQLVVLGSSMSDITCDKTENSIGAYDYWVIGLDTNGLLKWQKTIGGTDEDHLQYAIELANNNYMIFGNSQSGISGLKTEVCRGSFDYWLVEIANNYGISDLLETKIYIYPNPTTSSLTINGITNINTAEVYNISGKLLLTKQLNTNQLDISSLAKGLYLIKLSTEEGSLVSKFVKE